VFILIILILPAPQAISQDYFQQEVNYSIQVTLNDVEHKLSGFETIEYINHSPDKLQFLFFHLWANGYSSNQTPLARQILRWEGKQKLFEDPSLLGYIDSLDFRVNDQVVQWNLLSGLPDICLITLNEPLEQGDTIIITTPFRVKIPGGLLSRFGHIGQSYQISQWYPKPAVYDLAGWHEMPYLDQGEFFSEFGNYQVTITLPENYIVAATGNLQNDDEREHLHLLACDTTWKTNIHEDDLDFPSSSSDFKILTYKGDNIHDFAWVADKRFHVLQGEVSLMHSGRVVTIWLMFTNMDAKLWRDALTYAEDAISSFSNWIGDYPYSSFTVVQSAMKDASGMEYPGLALIDLTDDAYSLEEVIIHEAGHSWFYGAIGSNERRYPYMDEGITSAYTMRYMSEKYPDKKLWEVYLKNCKQAKFLHVEEMPIERKEEIEWLIQACRNLEQPIDLPAPEFSFDNSGVILYNKAARCFNYLRAYLGDSIFDLTMKEYYDLWKFKHPQPGDLQNVFEKRTHKDLTWFFKDLIGTVKRVDYKLRRFQNDKLLVKNKGEMVAPLVIAGIEGDSICFEMWIDGFEGSRWIDIPQSNYSEIKIDPNHIMPELSRLNNNIRKSGFLPKADPIRKQFLFTIEDPAKRSLIYVPAVNWNRGDGLMLGVMIHNGFILSKPFEYLFIPFVSTKNANITGYGKMVFNTLPYENIIRKSTITIEGSQFDGLGTDNFQKGKIGLDLYFRNRKMNNPFRQKGSIYFIRASNLSQLESPKRANFSSYLQLGYLLEKSGFINPFRLQASFESNRIFQKSSMEINYRYSYSGKKNGLDIRLFAGTMLKSTSQVPFYSFAPAGRSGFEQYLYEGYYPDRFSQFSYTFWSRQMNLSEGGLVSPINSDIGYSKWLISSSVSSNLPGKMALLPIKPFMNLLLNDHGYAAGKSKSSIFFEAGVKVGLWNFFEISIPFWVSSNISTTHPVLKERIRFILNLETIHQIKFHTGMDAY
jgi:hypothetical protein